MKVLALALFLAAPLAVAADPCDRAQEAAFKLMEARQAGEHPREAKRIAEDLNMHDEAIERVVGEVYRRPRASTEQGRRDAAEQFGHEMYLDCRRVRGR